MIFQEISNTFSGKTDNYHRVFQKAYSLISANMMTEGFAERGFPKNCRFNLAD